MKTLETLKDVDLRIREIETEYNVTLTLQIYRDSDYLWQSALSVRLNKRREWKVPAPAHVTFCDCGLWPPPAIGGVLKQAETYLTTLT